MWKVSESGDDSIFADRSEEFSKLVYQRSGKSRVERSSDVLFNVVHPSALWSTPGASARATLSSVGTMGRTPLGYLSLT